MKLCFFLRMLLITLALPGMAPLAALGVEGGPVKGLAIVLQVKSPEQLVALVKTTAKNFLPDTLFKTAENDVFAKLDLRQLKGIDAKKPFGAYATVGDKILQGDFSKSMVVGLIPIEDEKAFIAGLEAFGLQSEKKGEVTLLPIPGLPIPAALYFQKGYASIALKLGKIDPAELLDARDVFRDKETAIAALTIGIERFPEDLRKEFLTRFNQEIETQTAGLAQKIDLLSKEIPLDSQRISQLVSLESNLRTQRWLSRWMNLLVSQCKEVVLRADLNPKTGLAISELTFEPQGGTDLAKSIRAFQPTKNALANLVGGESAAHIFFQVPLFIGDFQGLLINLMQRVIQSREMENQPDAPREIVELIATIHKTLDQTIKEGTLDLATSLRGPDKNNQFTWVGGITVKDTTALEKALKAVLKVAPKEDVEKIKVGAFEVNGISVHEIDPPPPGGFAPQMQILFGKSLICVALAPKAIIVTYGPESREVIKEILSAKLDAQPAPLAEMQITGKRIIALLKLLGATPDAFTMQFLEKLTAGDKTTTLLRLRTDGGEKLVIHLDVGIHWLAGLVGYRVVTP